MEGSFWTRGYLGSRVQEITTDWGGNRRKAVRCRVIEDFIQRKTEENPFDLLRFGVAFFWWIASLSRLPSSNSRGK
jgi:hypothetical protein